MPIGKTVKFVNFRQSKCVFWTKAQLIQMFVAMSLSLMDL